MAPFVRVDCESCHEERAVHFRDMKLIAYPDGSEFAGFRCPVCKAHGMTPIPSFVGEKCRTFGFPVVSMPDVSDCEAEPLTEDDLIAFGLALESADTLDLGDSCSRSTTRSGSPTTQP